MYSIQIGEDENTILTIISLIVIGVIVGGIACTSLRKKPPKIKELYCAHYGAELPPGSVFCKKCGSSLE